MADTKVYQGNNFVDGTDKVITKYLNYAGLVDFWTKSKDYIDTQDSKLFDLVKEKVEAKDAAVRKYLHTITVNGENFAGYDATQPDKAPTSLDIVIGGEEIEVNHNGTAAAEGEKYAGNIGETTNKYTVREAFADVDTRLDGIETKLDEGVVSGIITTNTKGTYETSGLDNKKVSKFVTITEVGTVENPATGDVTLQVDDTALSNVIARIDDDIATLTANAGVTNIAVLDKYKDSDPAEGDQNLVEIVLKGSKDAIWSYPEGVTTEEQKKAYREQYEGDGAKRGDILISLDESKLDERLDGIDATVAAEIADRVQDIKNLAGTGYTPADGDTDGAWKKTDGVNFDVKYRDITSLSERLAQFDASLVTEIVDGNGDDVSNEKYVDFKVESVGTGHAADKKITLTLNDTKLQDYIDQNEGNWKKLAPTTKEGVNGKTYLQVNGHDLVEVDATNAAQVKVKGNNVTLTTKDIERPEAAQNGPAVGLTNLEDALAQYDAALAALTAATEFYGVVKFNPANTKPTDAGNGNWTVTADNTTYTFQNGDIVIYDAKEYILDVNSTTEPTGPKFIELGDVTAERARLTAIETWINTNIIPETGDESIASLDFEAPNFTWE
jgi:hypothetical protein